MKKRQIFILSLLASACVTSSFAASPVDLSHRPVSFLNSFLIGQTSLKQVSESQDFNQTTHIRLKQTFAGIPVWGGDIVVHIPKGGNTSFAGLTGNKNATMNGTAYQQLAKDLGKMPALETDKILQETIKMYRNTTGNHNPVSQEKAELMVYVDETNKAHWTYLVSFLVTPAEGKPAKPTYLIDAKTLHVYHDWDNIQTIEDAKGGGFGGNPKMGKLVYDGLPGNLPKLDMDRDANKEICSLKNSEVTVKDRRNNDAIMQFTCAATDPEHDNIWWSADHDAVNGGFSPSNDALYAGQVIQDMYLKWYNIPALVDSDGKQMMLNMRVHERMDNAYWDGSQMTFGDGVSMFYPLVSLGVGAHEVSHGFTQQHSGLAYWGQSGGLNEAFSDMAAQAAEFYSVGHNSWEIGPEILKGTGALRYMIQPSKDCNGKRPGNWCSIDKATQYRSGLDVHYSSGVFNRIFYLIGSAEGWDTKKAFDIMVKANQDYWTSTTNWEKAACGVLKAAEDYKYDPAVIKNAFDVVELDYSSC